MKSEKQKAALGELYNANYDNELLRERELCKDLCFDYNSLRPSLHSERRALITKILSRVGDAFHIEQPFQCDYGYNIEIGDNFYSNHNLIILDGAKVKIGNNVFIAPNCGIYTAGHPLDLLQRNQGLEYAYPITIGDNVWIGAGVSILPGVTIGDNVVVAAGSIVNKDIASNVVVAGNPARIIKKL
ncbi:MAG: sugar O-acetyltransferase [Bacteroidales bacterium]